MNDRVSTFEGWGEVKLGATRISYLARGAPGSSIPLVLLPSLGGGASAWGELGARLAAERYTLALDPRGFGRSSVPPPLLSTRGMAQELLAALDLMQVPRFDLFGLSLGSLVASWLAILAPRRVEHVVLASCGATGLDYAPRNLPRAWSFLRDLLLRRRPRPALARDLATRRDSNAALRAEAKAGQDVWSRARVLHFLSAVAGHDVREELRRLRLPTLLLHGERDVILDRESQAKLLALMPTARLCELPGAGHNLADEAAEASAQLSLEFLRGL